jgi:hypothetical protein
MVSWCWLYMIKPFFFGGIVDTKLLGHIMAHKTMHGLNNNGMGFIVIIDHKKMLR